MDPNTYEPKYLYLNEIYISELVFDNGDCLSLFGYLKDRHSNKLVRWDFFSDFSQLTDILLECGEAGEKLIDVLSKTLLEIVEIPTVIDVEQQLDTLLKVDQFIFKVYRPCEKGNTGEWHPTNDQCLFIDAIATKEKFIAENPSTYISFCKRGAIMADHLDDAIANIVVDPIQEELDELLMTLNKAYLMYEKLQAQKFSEKQSRKMAGLKDDFLFKIADLNNRLYREL